MDETIISNSNAQQGKNKVTLNNVSEKQKEMLLKGVKGIAGLAADSDAFALMGFTDGENPEPISSPSTDVNTTPSTTNIASNTDSVTIYTDSPFAHNVTDDMSFGEAFKTARTEVGEGGFFEWHGKLFNTYTADEWEQMSDDDKDDYWASIDEHTSHVQGGDVIVEHHVDVVEPEPDPFIEPDPDIDPIPEPEPNDDPAVIVSVEDFVVGIDGDGDTVADIYMLDANGNELPDLIIDTDYDGDLDAVIVDVDLENGYTGNEEIVIVEEIDINDIDASIPIVDISNDLDEPGITGEIVEVDDYDVIADNTLNPDEFDNDVAMDDFIV